MLFVRIAIIFATFSFFGGCAISHYEGSSGSGTRLELFPVSGTAGSFTVYDRGSINRPATIDVYDVGRQPVLVTKRDRNGQMTQMYWVCPGGGEPVAGKC